MNLIEQLNWRYATKRMNGTKVPQKKVDNIVEAIRLAPTSFGLQAFKVIEIEDAALRERIFNEACQQPQIKEGSHLLVFAANKKVTSQMVDDYMNQIASTRGIPVDALAGFKAAFDGVVAGNEEQNFVWTARQAYIAFGVGIVAAAGEQVDATPMEGFNPVALDEILGLKEQNLGSVTILALGYRDAESDQLATAPKVRKPVEDLIVKL
jgi:nitroreductase / dihydropteridine reductase